MNLGDLDRSDATDERQQLVNRLAISELAYVALLNRCVAHATQARPAAALPAWACVGPRNVGGRILSFVQDPVNANTLYAGSAHGGLWRSHDGGDTWVHLGDVEYNGPVGALALHPSQRGLLLMGTGAPRSIQSAGIGLWRVRVTQHDDSAEFERLATVPPPEQPPIAATNGAAGRYARIEVDPEDPRQFWVASQTGLWRCLVEPAKGSVPVWTLDFPPNPVPAGAALFSQTPTADNPGWPPYAHDVRVAIDPRVADTIVVDGRTVRRYLVLFVTIETAGVFRGRFDRQAGTIAWDPVLAVPNPPLGNPFGRGLVALCRSDPNHVYAVFENRTGNAVPENDHATNVYHSSDCGTVWTTAPTAAGRIPRAFGYTDPVGGGGTNGQADYSMVLEVHPTSPQVVACGEIDLCLSTDSALTWTPILQWQNYDQGDYAQHADQHVAAFDLHDRRRLWAGNDGGLSLARDLTAPDAAPGFWRKRSHGIVAGQFQDVTAHQSPQLSSMSGGGLQDNGSWLTYGGPTWYHISVADGGPMAIHAANPRQFLVTLQNQNSLAFIAAAPPVAMVNPVAAELPAPLRTMHVDLTGVYNQGPFVPALAQSPATPGEILLGWTSAPPLPPAFFLSPPVGNALGAANAFALPAPAVDVGIEGTAVCYGPVVPLPGTLEGWIGLSDGRLFHNTQAPNLAAWTNVPAFPVPGGVRHGITGIAPHPVNPAIVAVSTVPADRAIFVRVTAGGAPGGPAQFRVAFANPGGFGTLGPATPMPAGPFLLPQTSVVLSFVKAAFATTDRYVILSDGRIVVPAAATGAPTDLTAVSLAFVPITITINAPGGVVGTAPFGFQGAGVGGAGITGAAVDVGATGLVLRFAGGPFVAGHTWVIAPDGTVAPGIGAVGTVEVLARLHSRVYLSYNRGANWFDISHPQTRPGAGFGADTGSLPPGPVTSLQFELNGANLDLYAGTLAGVYRTAGLPAAAPVAPALVDTAWRPFNGPAGATLPLTLVNDLELIAGTRRLRAATFGRGIWDCDLAAAAATPRLLVRQTLTEDGRTYPRPFPHPLLPDDPRHLAGAVWLDHAHAFDIRIDSAPFDFFDDRVDGVEFDERMGVDDLVPLAEQAVYVQVHNWGFADATNVNVHLLFAPAGVAGPVLVGGAAPAVSMPAGLPTADTLYALPDFNPSGASPWRRVGPPQRITRLKPWEPEVVRFDWRPPVALAVAAPNDYVALVALCTAAGDPIPAAPLAAGTTLAAWIAQERRAALRLVRIRPVPVPALFVRDGVDDDGRLGNVPFAGRSPDLIVVQAAPPDPALAFRDLLATRAQDRVLIGGSNHVYLRVHNRGLAAVDAEVHVWTVAIDALGAPNFAAAGWTQLTPAVAPFLTVNVPAGGTALAHVALNNPADPAPTSAVKSIALVALIRSTDGLDPLPDPAAITDVQKFWDFFGTLFNSDNAALRVLRATT